VAACHQTFEKYNMQSNKIKQEENWAEKPQLGHPWSDNRNRTKILKKILYYDSSRLKAALDHTDASRTRLEMAYHI
jgi:hypothetical protein